MMTYCFDAAHMFVQDDGYMVMVGFADGEYEPSKFFILQKAHKYDEQDKQMGMNKVHIQIEDESRSKYGGIKAIKVMGDKIQISLKEDASSSLQIDGDIEIYVDVGCREFQEVVSVLRRMTESDGVAFEE